MFSILPGQIVFLQEPKNITVLDGMDAFFACTYEGINGVPSWRITNQIFVTNALPPRYSYNGSGLVVNSVDLSLNMTSYSCFFTVYQGGLRDIDSTTGFLIVAGLHMSSSHSGCELKLIGFMNVFMLQIMPKYSLAISIMVTVHSNDEIHYTRANNTQLLHFTGRFTEFFCTSSHCCWVTKSVLYQTRMFYW